MKFCLMVSLAALVAGCSTDHSPNIYASNAVQQANKVDAGAIIGFRQVMISANGTTGAVTGGAAGGVLGSQIGGSSFDQALGGVAGTALGAILGNTIEHVTGDTMGWEYIVRKVNGDLVSVTQVEAKPLALGQKVLVIGGPQARIVADYSVDIPWEKPVLAEHHEPPKKTVQEPPPDSSAAMPVVERPVTTDLPALGAFERGDISATELPRAAPALPE